MIKLLKDQQGIALVTSLLLTLIALAIISALFYMILWQTKLSSAHRRYKTAIEASQGGVDIVTRQVIPYIFTNNSTGGLAASLGMSGTLGNLGDAALVAGSSPCINFKLRNPTGLWGQKCGGANIPGAAGFFDPTQAPDVQMTLRGTTTSFNFSVYAKIVDTVQGNSDGSGFALLDSGSGVAGVASGVSPVHMPSLYRIEVQGQKSSNPQERARLSVLYAY